VGDARQLREHPDRLPGHAQRPGAADACVRADRRVQADTAAFLSKRMIDVDDAQRADGAYSDVARS
jgi:hypothetical protein